MRKFIIALSVLSFAAGSTTAFAAPCRDSHGKFTKCTTKAAAKLTRCRDAKGHYAKCGKPGTKPA